MNRRNVILSLVATVTLAVFGWANWPSAGAADVAKAKLSLGCGCCCEDPSCPPGCDESCPPDCDVQCLLDCCNDAACPPGCGASCPSDCAPCPTSAVAKPVIAKTQCGPDKCCPSACNVAQIGDKMQ